MGYVLFFAIPKGAHMKTCFLFPGQGAQYPGMAKDLWESSDTVKDLFSLASDATSMDLSLIHI